MSRPPVRPVQILLECGFAVVTGAVLGLIVFCVFQHRIGFTLGGVFGLVISRIRALERTGCGWAVRMCREARWVVAFSLGAGVVLLCMRAYEPAVHVAAGCAVIGALVSDRWQRYKANRKERNWWDAQRTRMEKEESRWN